MAELKERFLKAKKAILEKEYSRLNSMQQQAVFQTEGPVLILAGAGSGKTTVLVSRAENLIKYGNAYNSDKLPYGLTEEDVEFLESQTERITDDEKVTKLLAVYPAKPWQVMAITFTNKAAGELKNRLVMKLGEEGNDVWASTFHASSARMLRRDAERLGYTNRFTIYDTDDQRRLIKDIMSMLSIDEKFISHKVIGNEISRAKEKLLLPDQYSAQAGSDFRLRKVAEVYEHYQRRLIEADAMDFDDLLLNTVTLLEENEDILEYYRHRFRYIMIDEYQDTNHAQYMFVRMLADGHRNLCVVGDDDQSIYKFRGATIENILSFENQYEDATVIRLEQNYRSTGNILDAANAVIANNTERKSKRLWSDKGEGELVTLYTADTDREESKYIADEINSSVAGGKKYSDHAVLYRMNAQSNSLEGYLSRAGIPYRIIGGHRFYERKEIKDMLAYLCVISNPADEVRLRRIINEPKRGIGDKSVETASEIASQLSVSLFEVMANADHYQALSRCAGKMMQFAQMITDLADAEGDVTVGLGDLLDMILEKTGYEASLAGDEKKEERMENIQELKTNLIKFQEERGEDADLGEFLEEVALVADIDNYDSDADAVVLMTLHSAKGLEFPIVFIPGLEENIFPGRQSSLDPSETEEERRLAYVGITRAQDKLHLVHAQSRMLFGQTTRNPLSRFVVEIPSELLDKKRAKPVRRESSGGFAGYEKPTYNTATQMSGAASAQKKTVSESFSKGDRVLHKVFGEGEILNASPLGSDTLLEVRFEKVGVKKLMANFAGLKHI